MLYRLIRSCMFRLDPETAHHLVASNLNWATALGLHRILCPAFVSDPVEVMGIRFPNRVGLAAGMDKQGTLAEAFGRLGFGHVEAGTITPRPQAGNPKPRCWRIIPEEGIVNRMGFNNPGAEQAVRNAALAARWRSCGGVLGLNIGKMNATGPDGAAEDIRFCLRTLYGSADYFAVDVSCPNVQGGTALQVAGALRPILEGLAEERRMLEDRGGVRVPVTVKLGPDLSDDELRAAADLIVEHGMDGITATNTTRSREGVEDYPQAREAGGLSGRPLRDRATHAVRVLCDHLQERLPVTAVGGIMTPADAVEKMEAGAKLVQLYSGFIFNGPGLVGAVAQELKNRFGGR